MAENLKFFYSNLWKDYTLTETSEHENFVAENTQHRDFNKQWRSQHGAGSGWGNFKITAVVNDRLDHKDNGGTTRIGYLTAGEYTGDELAAHIETQLDATASADTFTVEYLEASNKFKITDDAGTFELLWNTGANKARSIADTIGFDDSADDTGADNYTADDMRIHSEEWIVIDMGIEQNIYGIIIRGHNLSANATVKAIFSTDNWTTISESIIISVQDDILIIEWDASKDYRYAGIWIEDRENADLYVALGIVFIGGQLQPTTTYLSNFTRKRIDPSEVQASENGQESSMQKPKYWTWTLPFRVYGSSEVSAFEAMENVVGASKAFFMCLDPSVPLTTTYYVSAVDWDWQCIKKSAEHHRLTISIKELV